MKYKTMTATTIALAAAGALMLAPAASAADAPTTVEIYWAMPNGGTAENVTWPQTLLVDGAPLVCEVNYQVDVYTIEDAALFTADGMLDLGEDYGSETQTGAISWRFVSGPECVDEIIVVPPVVVPPAEIVPAVQTKPELASTGVEISSALALASLLLVGGSAAMIARKRRA